MSKKRFSFQGWYTSKEGKFFFRSLKEISFISACNKNGQTWVGAETPEFTVTYRDLYGKERKHYPDFFVDGHIIVEVKPKKHQKGKLVQLKARAMREFCATRGYTYMMVSPRKINKTDLEELIEKKLIVFTDDCRDKIAGYLKRRR